MARVEELKKLSILDVAEALGMELKRQGTDRYVWVEHESFVISPRRNIFSWFSRDVKGDVIKLVQTIREEQTGSRPSFKTAKHFLEVGEFPEVDMNAAPAPKLAFEYRHESYEHANTSWTRDYLRRERKLSEDTITFFFQQGSIAEISHKMNDYSEPAIVFKFKNSQGKVMGASLQGIVENREKYPDRGYLKRILKNSDGLTGFYADVGRPKRLIFAESPIDVMSYYQLHPQLQDVRLVAMDGLKESLMSFRFAELVSELQGKTYEPGERTAKVLEATAKTSTFFQSNEDFITLAVDNDSAGWNFISKLQEKGIPFKLDIPPIAEKGVEKADWNSFLKEPLQGQAELVHIYSYDKKKKTAAYQGYFSKELAAAKVTQLTAGDVVAFSTSETLSRDEIEELATNQSQTYPQLSEAKESTKYEERIEGISMADQPNLERITSVIRGNTEYKSIAALLEGLREELNDPLNLEAAEVMDEILKNNPNLHDLLSAYADSFVLGSVTVNGYILAKNAEITYFEALTSDGEYLDLDKYKTAVSVGSVSDIESSFQEKRATIDQLIQDRDLKGLSAHLKEGVKDYFNSDTYKIFLNTMSKLNNYSLNNLFLIVAQKKDASAVASFKAWQKLGRHVLKGQKALKIWAPYQVTRKDEKGQPVLDKKGQEVKDTRFRLVPVFDVSQTDGKELPQPVYELEGTHQDYANLYRAAKETAAAKGVRLEISKEPMEAHGYYSPTENKIVIRAGMSERETLSTIFHEMAHADLHNPKALEGQKLTRTNKELQAESVAYVVANHYGLDTSSYSFGYLANWSKEPDSLADLEAQLSIVQKEASDLIKRLDTAFEKYQNKEVSKDPLSQKLEEFNQKCQKKLAEKAASEPEKKSHPQKGDEEKDNQASK
jgi:pcfD